MSLERVYFECNSLFSRWPGKLSGEMRILASLARMAGVQVWIPNSAIIEHEHSTARRAKNHIKKAQKEIDALNLSLNGVLEKFVVEKFDSDAWSKTYAVAVQQACEGYGFFITPSTTMGVEDFVRLASKHDPPFKNEDVGFRDAVHFYSVIDHLRSAPMSAGGTAVLITADDRLADPDVSGTIREANLELRVVKSLREAIRLVWERLANATQKQLGGLETVWREPLLADVRKNLLPRILKRLEGVELPKTGTQLLSVTPTRVQLEPLATTVAPAPPGQNNRYDVNFEIRLTLDTVSQRMVEIAAGFRIDVIPLPITVLVDIYANVDVNDAADIRRIEYRSARAFSIKWTESKKECCENLPEAIELLDVPEGESR